MRILDIFREAWERYQAGAGLRGLPDTARIHCEMAGELLSEAWVAFLAAYPRGMIQLEIGVQSIHQNTLSLLRRRQDFDRWAPLVAYLQHGCGIPVHMDLIAGLPGEDKAAVLASVDRVMGLRPGHLQLGFLKMLKGAPWTEQGGGYGIVASPDPPYEVLRTGSMRYEDLLELHRIEDMLEKYYNGGFLRYGVEAMAEVWGSFAELFRGLAGFWLERGWLGRQWSRLGLIQALRPFLWEGLPDEAARGRCVEALRFDYYLAGHSARNLPDWLAGPAEEGAGGAYPQLDKEAWRCRLPVGQTVDKRQWARRASVSCFNVAVPRRWAGPNLAAPGSEARGLDVAERDGSERGGSEAGVFWYVFLARVGAEVGVWAWED
jgi:hypothetical protein